MTGSLDTTSSPGEEKGWMPLMCAAEAGDIDTLTALLTDGCDIDIDIDARDYDGCTSLALAAQNGHAAVVERLLEHNANPNLSDLNQITPLWKAARYGHTSAVQLLLASEEFLDVNSRPADFHRNRQETPLSIALKQGHQETAELLSRADGIDLYLTLTLPHRSTYEEVSILGFAIRMTFEDIALSLLDKLDLGNGFEEDDCDNDIIEPVSKLLVFAVASGCSRVVQELLKKHTADVNTVQRYYSGQALGWVEDSALMAASRRGDLNTVRMLLDLDEIRPCVHSKHSGTALTAAAQGGFVDVVKLLIADGRVEVGLGDDSGRTALSFAAESGSKAIVDEMLATGAADPNGQDSQAKTPLIWAVSPRGGYGPHGWHSYEGVIRSLLAHSEIAVNAEDCNGHTALSYAAEHGALGLVVILLEHPQIDVAVGFEKVSPLAVAAFHHHADVVQVLLSTGKFDVNAELTGVYDRTVLMAVVEYGGVKGEDVVRVLLSAACIDVNLQNGRGTTALMLAASGGTVGMVKQILNAGGNPNIQDHDGNTALFRTRSIEIFEALLGAPGIKPDLANKEGRTALSLAAEYGNIEKFNALIARDDVNPDSRDVSGRGPISWVFGKNGLGNGWEKEERKAVLQRLLGIPAIDPHAEDHNGLSPLLLAIKSDQGHEYVEILLSRPDLDANQPQTRDWASLLDTANQRGNRETIALLRARGASESLQSAKPHRKDEELAVKEEVLSGADSVFEETRQNLRLRQHARRPSSQASESESDEPNFDRTTSMTTSLVGCLIDELQGKHTLRLGEQQAYADGWAESSAGMCSSCSNIDLGSAFSRRHAKYEGHVIADLGRVDETWKKRSCPLCRLFATVYPLTSPGEGHKLVSFSTTQSWLCNGRLTRWNDLRFKSFVDNMLLAVVAADSVVAGGVFPTRAQRRRDPSPSRSAQHLVKAAFSSGLIGRLGRNGLGQESVTIPRLATEISDWSVARGWITMCRENHPRDCNPRRAATIPHLFLIECSKRQIVQQKESEDGGPPPYVALSYVWGQSKGSQQPPQRQKHQESLDKKGDDRVEAAIEDAIQVTLGLGYNYLWVDRYCVVQMGDEAIKQEQLRHMHLVYANAEVTLIAVAGEDSSAGLPGVPGRPRNQQLGALIQGHALVCIPPDPSLHIRSHSTWATRGWTYQEGLLARRRLYFSEYEMSYECRHMLCREAIRLPRSFEERITGYKPRFMEPFWLYQPYKVPGMGSSQTGIEIFGLLALYTKRKLSLPSDTLNAMLGILGLLAQHKTRPVYHICGVPVLRLTDPRPGILEGRRQKPTALDNEVAATVSLGGFLDGLCWRLEEPAHRFPSFPSWSWTGWQGIVAGMNENSGSIKQPNEFAIDVSIIPGNQDGGASVPWSRCYDSLRMADGSDPDIRSGQSYVLGITASSVTVRLRRGEYDGRPNTWIGTVCVGDGVWQGEFFLTSKDLPLSSLLEESWTGIVLGNSQGRRYSHLHDTTVVVIQEQKQNRGGANAEDYTYCERVGLLRLVHCSFDVSMLDQKIWRLR